MVDKPQVEYLDGVPYPKVSPKRIHAQVQLAAAMLLKRCAGSRGIVGTEWRFHPGAIDATRTDLVPDVAYVSIERLQALEPAQRDEPPFSPDIGIEVRSPSHRLAFSEQKIERYLRSGSVLILDVDPGTRTIEARTREGARTFAAGQTFTCDLLPWLTFEVDEVFADLDLAL